MTAPLLSLRRVVATPGALKLLIEARAPPSITWPAMPQGTGETSVPSTAARTRSPGVRVTASSAPIR